MSNVLLPPAVAALLAEGQAVLEAEREAEKAAYLAQRLAAQRDDERRIAAILAAARRLLPAALQGYLSYPYISGTPNTNTTYCLLQVPGCVPVRVSVAMYYCHLSEEWQPTEDEPHPQAKLLTLPVISEGDWTFYQSREIRPCSKIGKVLAEAHELEAQRLAWLEDVATWRVYELAEQQRVEQA